MSKILELREKRAKAWDAAKAFLDTKRTDDGLMSAEDAAVYDRMETEVVPDPQCSMCWDNIPNPVS